MLSRTFEDFGKAYPTSREEALMPAPRVAVVAAVLLGLAPSAAGAAYTFEDFKADFGKAYPSPREEARRRSVFEARLREIESHNAAAARGEISWTQRVNQFSDVPRDEFRDSHGWVSPRRLAAAGGGQAYVEADPDFRVPADFKLEDLPTAVDWRTKGVVSPVKNQGMCGSCWAFSSTENIESHVALATNATAAPVLSPQNLVSCDPNPNHCGGTGGCRGSIPELAFDWVKEHGLASEADYPYRSGHTSLNEPCNTSAEPAAHITGYTKLTSNNYTEVMYALAYRGPVAVNVDAIPMQSYGGGLMTGCALDKTHIDHVVQLVGYGYDATFDKNYWWLRNSWCVLCLLDYYKIVNTCFAHIPLIFFLVTMHVQLLNNDRGTTWGIDGYMKLERHDPKDNWCSLDIYPADGTGCDGGPGTVKVCGACGVLYDVSYPIGGSLV